MRASRTALNGHNQCKRSAGGVKREGKKCRKRADADVQRAAPIRSVGVDPAPRLGVAIGDALQQGRKEATDPPKPAGPLHT